MNESNLDPLFGRELGLAPTREGPPHTITMWFCMRMVSQSFSFFIAPLHGA
jgi:hypothetical protein